MSIFINMLLSVARTIKTVSPFSEVKIKWALTSLIFYGGFWTVLASLDVFSLTIDTSNTDTKKITTKEERLAHLLMDEKVGKESLRLVNLHKDTFVNYFITYIIPYLLPVLICLISACIMIVYLRKETPSQQSALIQRHVTVTVLFLTICFVLCFGTPALYQAYIRIENRETKIGSGNEGTNDFIGNEKHIFESTFPILNALFNPLILICRSREIRQRLKDTMEKFGRNNRVESLDRQEM